MLIRFWAPGNSRSPSAANFLKLLADGAADARAAATARRPPNQTPATAPRNPALWHRLFKGSWGALSESGRLRQGTGGHPRDARRRRGLTLTMLSSRCFSNGPATSRRRGRLRSFSVVWKRRAVDRVARAAPAALAAAGSRRARGAAGHESAGERRGLLAVLVERGLKPREGPITLRQADSVYRQVVHKMSVEHVLGVTAAAHAGRRLLGHAQERAKGLDVLLQYRFVTEVTRHFGEVGKELVHGHRSTRRPRTLVEIPRQTNLNHRVASITHSVTVEEWRAFWSRHHAHESVAPVRFQHSHEIPTSVPAPFSHIAESRRFPDQICLPSPFRNQVVRECPWLAR